MDDRRDARDPFVTALAGVPGLRTLAALAQSSGVVPLLQLQGRSRQGFNATLFLPSDKVGGGGAPGPDLRPSKPSRRQHAGRPAGRVQASCYICDA